MLIHEIPAEVLAAVRRGVVIPAQPLALNAGRRFDWVRQQALTRYYIDAGAGGVAVGVHTTQFEIRDPNVALFKPVLEVVSEAADNWCRMRGKKVLKVAGACGKTAQAVKEAQFAQSKGYHACLLSLAAMTKAEVPEMIAHCREVAQVMPLIGFYLQPAVGGRLLPYAFWREFAEIPNVLAIKIAPFNRYQTLDVIRGLADADKVDEISLYTGNDDNIVFDLLTEHRIQTARGPVAVRIVGGLLGHWSVWTKKAVELLDEIHDIVDRREPIPPELLTRAIQITDCNAAFFDPAHQFKGCIPGLHEVLRRQGLLEGTWCLNQDECLSPGQAEEIDRVYHAYPHLHDDAFVQEHLQTWLTP